MEPDTVDRERPHPNSYWVIEGRFAAGEYPGDLDPVRAESKVRGLLDGGIDHFVDLTEARELEPYAPPRDVGRGRRIGRDVGWVRRPIRDVSVPDRPQTDDRDPGCHRCRTGRWQDRLRPLLGRSGENGNSHRMLAGASRQYGRQRRSGRSTSYGGAWRRRGRVGTLPKLPSRRTMCAIGVRPANGPGNNQGSLPGMPGGIGGGRCSGHHPGIQSAGHV